MSASKKVIENSQRLRYIRALERFHKGMLSYLANTTQLTKEGYAKKITASVKLLSRIDSIALYKGELQDLQKFVQKMIDLKDSSKSIEDIKDDILYSANQLDKNKNSRRYKKDKHTNSKYEDWE